MREMKIAMFTNTYVPHVGGVARSVDSFAQAYRRLKHSCLVIAPEFDEAFEDHRDTYRVPAITNFNDSGFSFKLPFLGRTSEALDAFKPDIIHAHHPFLLGDTAMRYAYSNDIPIVFTHHTLYEEYTNYLPFDSDFTKKAASEIATSFANACSHVFAPSGSIATLIKERGVETPVSVQPTGIAYHKFAHGNGKRFRKKHDIPLRAPLIGHVGRIAKEKNLDFLLEAIFKALQEDTKAHAAIVGDGELLPSIKEKSVSSKFSNRIHLTGTLNGDDLYDAYASFDLFAFASQSETQGLVLAEAMAGGAAVVALDGPGVRDVLVDGKNGTLLPAKASSSQFSHGLIELLKNRPKLRRRRKNAQKSAADLSIENQSKHALRRYQEIIAAHEGWIESTGISNFDSVLSHLEGTLQLLRVKANTLSAALSS